MTAFAPGSNNRGMSWTATIGMPDGWGPGPWDNEENTFSQRARQCGDLRAWLTGLSTCGGRILTKSNPSPNNEKRAPSNLAELRPRDPTDVVKVPCWCGAIIVKVDVTVVQACKTVSCHRPWCDDRCRRIRKR